MVWRFQQVEPQPARGKLTESMWDDPEYIAEEKYDGDRRIAQFCGKVVRFTGRRKSVDGSGFVEKTENVPHLSGIVHDAVVPLRTPPASLDGTVLDGEMIWVGRADTMPSGNPGGMSKYVTSIMGSLPEEAVRKQIERGWLRYVVFDCLWFEGQDLRSAPLYKRRQYAEQAVGAWGNPFASISLLAGLPGRQKRGFRDAVLARGGEGVILKDINAPYGEPQSWVKVKGEWTADVVIMGFIPAKEVSKKVSGEVSMTKYAKAGLIGAIMCGQWRATGKPKPFDLDTMEVATVSGMDDDLRADITAHPKKYLGQVLEIKQNGREPTGRFRHPRWFRLRPDKQAKDCIYREGEI